MWIFFVFAIAIFILYIMAVDDYKNNPPSGGVGA